MSLTAKKMKTRCSVGLLALWASVSLFIMIQTYNMTAVVQVVEELGNKVEQTHNTFAHERSQRIGLTDDISLNLQIIYALRIQLEANYAESYFAPDVSQFIYSTDHYLQSIRSLLSIDNQLSSLVDEIREKRLKISDQSSFAITQYALLGSYVSEAAFSTSPQLDLIFKDIDDLLLASETLPDEYGLPLRQLIAASGDVLAENLQIDHLVQQVNNHAIYTQQSKLEEYVNRMILQYMMVLIAISALSVLGMLFLLYLQDWGEETQALENAKQSKQAHDQEASLDALIRSNSEKVMSYSQESLEEGRVIDTKAMLDSLSGDEASVRLLLQVFIQDHRNDYQRFTDVLVHDKVKAQRIVHSLKGVAANLGALRLKDVAFDIEMTMKNGHNVSEQQLAKLEEALRETIDFAKQLLDETWGND
ncbi:Hpt domain-containing protein [Vibrio cidicii]|uniref:Hpt domain-containing protein n=1 Tax=Vibrio cidicii TaxID=1763883 RepID=UPI003F516163